MRGTPEWALGTWGERQVRRWCQQQGWFVVPMHLIEDGGAPALVSELQKHVLPDFQVASNGRVWWVEVKTKTKAARFNKAQEWRHGVDLPNWEAYREVERITGIPGTLMIVQLEPELALLVAPFTHLEPFTQICEPKDAFPRGMVFWPRDRFEWLSISAEGPNLPRIEPKVSYPWDRPDDGPEAQDRLW